VNKVEKFVEISNLSKVKNSTLKFYSRVKDYAEVSESYLGEYSYISQYSMVNKTNIGKFVSIASGCYIGLWEHNIEVSTHSFYLYEHSGNFVKGYTNYDKDNISTVIGNDVWIGANSVILKGVTINDGAIIGAGSVVTKDVPSYAIVVGNPARVLKLRYSKKEITWLKNLQWWDFDRDKIQKLVDEKAFTNFDIFKKKLDYKDTI